MSNFGPVAFCAEPRPPSPGEPDRSAGDWTACEVAKQLRIARGRDLKEVSWLINQLAGFDASVARLYVEGTPWKCITTRFGMSRSTANLQLQYLATVIAWRLNRRDIPTTWSRRYLLDRERELSSDEQRGHVDCVRHLRVGQPRRAASFIGPVSRIAHADVEATPRRSKPPDSEDAAQNRGPRAADNCPPGLAERGDQAGKGEVPGPSSSRRSSRASTGGGPHPRATGPTRPGARSL